MRHVYAIHEARARFSEVIDKVRRGERVVVTYRGEEIAEIRPLPSKTSGLEARLRMLEDRGLVVPAAAEEARVPWSGLRGERRPGALARFLKERGED